MIWATGFDVARFVGSFEVVGVGGETLRDFWEDDNPRAYLGVSVPGFPNFFMLGGPNSFPGSGSFMYFMEVQMRYIRRLLTEQFRRRVRPDGSRSRRSTTPTTRRSTRCTSGWSGPTRGCPPGTAIDTAAWSSRCRS